MDKSEFERIYHCNLSKFSEEQFYEIKKCVILLRVPISFIVKPEYCHNLIKELGRYHYLINNIMNKIPFEGYDFIKCTYEKITNIKYITSYNRSKMLKNLIDDYWSFLS